MRDGREKGEGTQEMVDQNAEKDRTTDGCVGRRTKIS